MRSAIVSAVLAALVGAAVAAGAVVLVFGGSTKVVKTTTAKTASTTVGSRSDVAVTTPTATEIYKSASKGVVAIKVVTAEGEDSGTGIVLNDKGLILTNDHVVKGGESITVTPDASSSSESSSSGASSTASIVGEEANEDVALIKINPSGMKLEPLEFASSSDVEVGETVYALGNPYDLDATLTKGIVSALGREIEAPDGAKIKKVIQTDAALNPGNSGGPLLNDEGKVIGLDSQIASDATETSTSQPGSTGVGFAESSNMVLEAIKTIEAGKGVSYKSATKSQTTEAEHAYGTTSPYGEEAEAGASPYGEEAKAGASPYGGYGYGAESPYGQP